MSDSYLIILLMANFLKKSLVLEIDNYLDIVNLELGNCSSKSFTSSTFVLKRKT